MKKFFIIFFAIFLTSCQNLQNSSKNPDKTATGTEISQNSETEKISQKYESVNSDWPEFHRPFGEKFELERDFCVKDLCIKAGTPVYQDKNGEIMQMQYIREHLEKEGHGDEGNKYSEHFYTFGEMEVKTDENGEKYLSAKSIDGNEFNEKFPNDSMLEYRFWAIPSKNYIVRERSEPFHLTENTCVEVKK